MNFDIESFLKKNFKVLRNYCWVFTRNTADADMLLSEALEKIWLKRETFKGDSENEFGRWCYLIIKTLFLNSLKSNKVRRTIELNVELHDRVDDYELEEHIKKNEKEELLLKEVDKLPKKCKNIFKLAKIEDMKYKEIAEMLKVSVKTIDNQIAIAMKKIRDGILNYKMEYA
jgi:RNA polymerase sigma-70 factor (ECF subfamily)